MTTLRVLLKYVKLSAVSTYRQSRVTLLGGDSDPLWTLPGGLCSLLFEQKLIGLDDDFGEESDICG